MADDPNASPTPDEPASATDGPPGLMGRRTFLNTAWKVLGAGLVVEAAWTSYDILNPHESTAAGGVIDAGPASDYATEGATYFSEGQFWLASSSGQVVALYQKCPHLGCKVPFNPATDRFECPCHGSKYNILGEYIEGPAPRGMDRFLIKVNDHDEVLVDTSTLVPGPKRGVNTVANSAGEAPGEPADGAGGGTLGEATT
jgi:cytochrome b6-f complex iron-sulfur subunit